jgi:hypothetical protein
MSYIGSKPADAVLETDDIADGVVTNPKLSTGSQQNFRNIIINGDMSIAQRGTSTASITSDGFYSCDRWKLGIGSFGTWTQSQSTDVPTGQGFATSLKMDCTTAQASPASGSSMLLEYSIEGQHLQEICQGTANAKQTTLSFWHKHTKTGINTVELLDADNNNAVSGSYTQSVSNTWEKAVITFPAHTTGAYDNDNARSLRIRFAIAKGTDLTSGTLATTWQTSITNANRHAGQVNNADNTANNFIITGVQYEVGTTPSDFEFLPFDVNLQRCQRYYQLIAQGISAAIRNAFAYNSTQAAAIFSLPNPMRATPSIDQTSGASYYRFQANATNYAFSSFTFDFGTGNQIFGIRTTSITGLTGGHSGNFQATNASSYFALTSEL